MHRAFLIVTVILLAIFIFMPVGAQDAIYLPLVNSASTAQSPTSTATFTQTPLSTPTNTSTRTPTSTSTTVATLASTATPTATPTETATATPTETPTITPPPASTPCGTLAGVLSVNTILTSGCQYEIPSNVLVPEGITLSAPSSIVLKFNSTVYMRVDGAIVVDGTENDPVVFTRNSLSSWGGLRITEKSKSLSSLSNAIFEYARGERAPGAFAALNAANAQPSLSNLTFRNNGMPFYLSAGEGYTLTLKGGKVYGNDEGGNLAFGRNVIDSVDFFNNFTSQTNAVVSMCPGNSVLNSMFTDNNALAILGNDCSSSDISYIKNNTIANNRGAIAVTHGYSVTIQSNAIYSNSQVSLPSVFQFSNMQAAIVARCAATLTGNNIYGNTATYAIRSRAGDCDIAATNNWWGTTVTSEVDSLIYDYFDDFTLVDMRVTHP